MIRAILLTFVLAATTLVTPGAGATCAASEAVHAYVLSPSAGLAFNGAWFGTGTSLVHDGCLASPATFTGDNDLGVGGGQFPAGGPCAAPAPSVAHHAGDPGAEYHGVDQVATMAFTVGTDGIEWMVPDPTSPGRYVCGSNGVVSDDPTTDPYDCGSGSMGFWTGVSAVPATLAENLPGMGCAPVDGHVVASLVMGPAFVGRTPLVDATDIPPTLNVPALQFVSTPTLGRLWG